jgi:hypothetical protein
MERIQKKKNWKQFRWSGCKTRRNFKFVSAFSADQRTIAEMQQQISVLNAQLQQNSTHTALSYSQGPVYRTVPQINMATQMPPMATPVYGQQPLMATPVYGQQPPMATPVYGQQPLMATPVYGQQPPMATPVYGQQPPSSLFSVGTRAMQLLD